VDETAFSDAALVSGVVMMMVVVMTRVMRNVAMMPVGSEGRCCKDHKEERSGKYLLHGINLTRCNRRR
jgi:hypothetical protein